MAAFRNPEVLDVPLSFVTGLSRSVSLPSDYVAQTDASEMGGLHFDMGPITHACPHLDPDPLPVGQGFGGGELQSISALSSEHERVHSVLFRSHPAAPTPHIAFE